MSESGGIKGIICSCKVVVYSTSAIITPLFITVSSATTAILFIWSSVIKMISESNYDFVAMKLKVKLEQINNGGSFL
jgi:hypothetical protein